MVCGDLGAFFKRIILLLVCSCLMALVCTCLFGEFGLRGSSEDK